MTKSQKSSRKRMDSRGRKPQGDAPGLYLKVVNPENGDSVLAENRTKRKGSIAEHAHRLGSSIRDAQRNARKALQKAARRTLRDMRIATRRAMKAAA